MKDSALRSGVSKYWNPFRETATPDSYLTRTNSSELPYSATVARKILNHLFIRFHGYTFSLRYIRHMVVIALDFLPRRFS